jgi:uncharacterized protein YcnI
MSRRLFMSRKIVWVAAAAAAYLTASAAPAAAHVTAVQTTAPADGFATIELQVPHGCEGQPTNELSVQLRDDISSVKAEAVPGWTVSYDRQPLDEPIDVFGEEVTEYVASVTWTATGQPLPDDQYLRFGISMKMPNLEGEQVLLPTVQRCVGGSEAAWVDEDPESEHPAPAVELTAAEAGGHDGGESDDGESEDTASESTDGDARALDADTVASTSDDSDGLARGLSAAALVVAVIAAVVSTRRRAG